MIRSQYLIISTVALGASLLASCGETVKEVKTEATPTPAIETTPTIAPSAGDVKEAGRYRLSGLQYRERGRFAESISALKKSVSLDPANLSGRVVLGWTEHLAGRGEEAAATLEETLRRNPDYVPALNALGIVYLVGGKLNQAVTTHTKARRLKPDNEIAYYNLALAYHRLQNLQSALSNAEEAIALEPDNPHPLVAKAMIQWERGEKKEAKNTYRRAIALDPRYRGAGFLTHLAKAGFSGEQIEIVERVRSF